MRLRAWTLVLPLHACTGTVSVTQRDAASEAPLRDATADLPTPPMDREVARDTSELRDLVDASDARDVPDAGRCPPRLPDGGAPPPPPGVSRSCGPGGAPSWHCNEVPYCGGEFTMGSTNAAEIRGQNDHITTFRMRDCDPRVRRVRGGYIDAYEVTVARFRQWVRAGMPLPEFGDRVYPVGEWTISRSLLSMPNYANTGDGDTVPGSPATNANCTWSPVDGVHDDLPINCVNGIHAIAFCWWDGRHPVSEEAWEYLASNYGTTSQIRPEDLTLPANCGLGDLNSRNGICERRDLPRAVNLFPLSGPPTVPGLFGMIGGVQDGAAGPFLPLDGTCSINGVEPNRCCGRVYPITDDHAPREGACLRGSSWWVSEGDQRWLNRVSSRSHSVSTLQDSRSPQSPNVGIRCARWVEGVW